MFLYFLFLLAQSYANEDKRQSWWPQLFCWWECEGGGDFTVCVIFKHGVNCYVLRTNPVALSVISAYPMPWYSLTNICFIARFSKADIITVLHTQQSSCCCGFANLYIYICILIQLISLNTGVQQKLECTLPADTH